MTNYRLYHFDRHGRIDHATTVDCPDDEAAIQACEPHRSAAKMELWDRGRLVKVFADAPATPDADR